MPGGFSPDRRKQVVAEILLVAVTAVWGWTFVVVKDAVAILPPLPFLTVRFGVAAAVMALGLLVLRAGRPGEGRGSRSPAGRDSRSRAEDGGRAAEIGAGRARVPGWSSGAARAGAVMGAFLAAGYVFQTFGLQRTTPSNAGFITGMFVVIVPVFQGLLWRRWPGPRALIGVAMATVGLFLLSGGTDRLNLSGDGLVFLCALSFAAHILATSRYVGRYDAAVLTVAQLAVVAFICAGLSAAMWASGTPLRLDALAEPEVLLALGVTSILASAAAFYIQTFAQRYASATRTAVILTMEPVFAGLFGYALAGDRLTVAGWVGAAAIVAGMLASESRRADAVGGDGQRA